MLLMLMCVTLSKGNLQPIHTNKFKPESILSFVPYHIIHIELIYSFADIWLNEWICIYKEKQTKHTRH